VSAPTGAWVKAPEDIVEDNDEDNAGEGQMPLWEGE
jgi:hypothetical protein